MPARLSQIATSMNDAMNEAKKIKELTIQEEDLVELEKVNTTHEQAKKAIAAAMNR